MPALVMGNTVVFKPSQFSPKSAWNLVKLFEEAAAAGRAQPRVR
ncbi:MAG: aldehyde dehydrogenase family protein [Dehalococcoidia bacterium]